MCLSTVYINSEGGPKTMMKDVARIEAEAKGYWFIDLFGRKKFVEGRIQSIDLYHP
jgi:predicted RNA-binding protein